MELRIRNVGVIGAGQMGNGIAHVCALAGFSVRLNDLSLDQIKSSARHHQWQPRQTDRQRPHYRG